MYSIRVNARTKALVEEVADMVGLSVSSIFRKVQRKMLTGSLELLGDDVVAVKRMNGDVIKIKVNAFYHNSFDGWLTADIEPLGVRETRNFRNCLIAACTDTRNLSKEQYEKKKQMDKTLDLYNSQLIKERRALYAEVM